MSKALVAYFSASGVTAGIAEKLAPSCPGAALLGGKRFGSNAGEKELKKWADSLKL